MKDIINSVLYRHSSNQSNLASEKCRDAIASEIEAVLESKGSYTEYSDYELEKREAKKHWVCSICGKNTFDVDYDYIGSGTNHLGCELARGQKEDTPVPTRERGPDRRKSDRRNDGHREYPYNSFVKSKEDIQKQIYTEMTSDGLPAGGDTQAVKESNKLAEEIVDSADKNYIYESPDGGETIYKREFGNDKRRKLSFPELVNLKGEIKNEND